MIAIRVLLIEDDERLARSTAEYLESHGLDVQIVGRDDLAIADVQRIEPDVVVLDLPGIDAADVGRELRRRHDVPIIVITDRVAELDGADLLARIRARVSG